MKEHFTHLRRLQETDLELKNLQERFNDMPKRIQELNRSIEEMKKNLENVRQALLEHKKQYKLAEVDLRSVEEKIATYSGQLYSAKTNEQYKAFLKEIENQKRLKNEIEDRMIFLMEKIEETEKQIKKDEQNVAETEINVARKIDVLEREKNELAAAIAEREKIRSEITTTLPVEILRRYEKIRANKGGLAVTSTENGRCNGCLSPIPPQRLLEIERQDKLYLCESCGRILLPVEDSPPRSK